MRLCLKRLFFFSAPHSMKSSLGLPFSPLAAAFSSLISSGHRIGKTTLFFSFLFVLCVLTQRCFSYFFPFRASSPSPAFFHRVFVPPPFFPPCSKHWSAKLLNFVTPCIFAFWSLPIRPFFPECFLVFYLTLFTCVHCSVPCLSPHRTCISLSLFLEHFNHHYRDFVFFL